MALFAITFRIEYDTEARYDRVYKSLVAAIVAETNSTYWDDPTSFFLITSGRGSSELADAIIANTSGFDTRKDLVFVVNLSTTQGHSAKGRLIDKGLSALMASR